MGGPTETQTSEETRKAERAALIACKLSEVPQGFRPWWASYCQRTNMPGTDPNLLLDATIAMAAYTAALKMTSPIAEKVEGVREPLGNVPEVTVSSSDQVTFLTLRIDRETEYHLVHHKLDRKIVLHLVHVGVCVKQLYERQV